MKKTVELLSKSLPTEKSISEIEFSMQLQYVACLSGLLKSTEKPEIMLNYEIMANHIMGKYTYALKVSYGNTHLFDSIQKMEQPITLANLFALSIHQSIYALFPTINKMLHLKGLSFEETTIINAILYEIQLVGNR